MKQNDSRRKLLKSIAVGSGAVVAGKSLPDTWTKPVINSVMLPVHASTTDDTDSGGDDTTSTTMGPCVIEGDYCWIEGNNARTIIAVTSEGGITITRTLTKPAMSWTGTGTTSNGAMGGTFSINAPLNNEGRARDYTGTVVCNSPIIEATVDIPGSDTPTVNFEATQAACSGVPG